MAKHRAAVVGIGYKIRSVDGEVFFASQAVGCAVLEFCCVDRT